MQRERGCYLVGEKSWQTQRVAVVTKQIGRSNAKRKRMLFGRREELADTKSGGGDKTNWEERCKEKEDVV